jgi:hypothetical protein
MPLWMNWPNPSEPSHGYPNGLHDYQDYTSPNSLALYGTSDYPWYNPVWPEKDAGVAPQNINTDIVWERGTVHLFGSIAQQHRGFMHRSGVMDLDLGAWDVNNPVWPKYGPSHNASGYGSTGYQTDYKYDKRFSLTDQAASPYVNKADFKLFKIGSNSLDSLAFKNDFYSLYVSDFNDSLYSIVGKSCEINQDNLIIKTWDYDNQLLSSKSYALPENNVFSTIDYLYPDYLLRRNNSTAGYSVVKLENDENYSLIEASQLNNPCLYEHSNGAKYVFDLDEQQFKIYQISNGQLILKGSETISDNTISINNAKLYVKSRQANQVEAICLSTNLYRFSIDMSSIVPTDPIDNEQLTFKASHYPNPFNPEIKISFQMPKQAHAELNIYNVKGQKVKTLVNEIKGKGMHSVIWNGKNEAGKSLASGVYFYQVRTGNQQIVNKILMLK